MGGGYFQNENFIQAAFFIALLTVLQGQSQAQVSDTARIKCSEFRFKEKLLPLKNASSKTFFRIVNRVLLNEIKGEIKEDYDVKNL